MSTLTHHPPGTFCWSELATSDAGGAIEFYTQLFGWTVHETPSPAAKHFVLRLDGRDVAALFELASPALNERVAPHWRAFVSVASADEAARLAREAGGRVLLGPFDVRDAGRTATFADDQGATFSVWQAIGYRGAGVLGEPGALGWAQLNTRDAEAAKRFYPAVFGWRWRDDPMGPDTHYTTWLKADGPAGGMMTMPREVPAGAPAHWLVYFIAASVDESHARAIATGARSMVAPTGAPGGPRFSVLCDPQGAMFALVSRM